MSRNTPVARIAAFYFTRVGKPGSPRPVEIESALDSMGFDKILIDEEASGDGRWHVAAFDNGRTQEAVSREERLHQMQELAQQTSSTFDGGVIVG